MNSRITAAAALVAALLGSSSLSQPTIGASPAPKGSAGSMAAGAEWRYYAGTLGGTKYSSLDQINASNVGKLQIAWRIPTSPPEVLKGEKPNMGLNFEHTPLMVDGLLYFRSDSGPLMAVDPTTGKTVWIDTEAEQSAARTRGLSYWSDGKDARLFTLDGENLIAVNAKTGKRYADFGAGGKVDLKVYADPRPNSPVEGFSWSSFPVVVGDTVIIAGVPDLARDKVPAGVTPAHDAPGDIRGYDVRTGKLVWTFHVIPRKGEFGYETWHNDTADMNGLGGTWSWLTGDEELGYVYIATEAPSNDFYGGHRPGNNLFGNSVLCLDAKTGKRVWHYQIIHHDLWDFDNPVPPVLIDITVDGKPIKALAQLTKQAYTFVLDRTNGQPVWPIEEKPVPAGTVPGEWYSPTQPIPSKPAPLEPQQLTPDLLIDFTRELKAAADEVMKPYKAVPVYTPANIESEIVMMPGTTGAANWNGASFDPETGRMYVPVLRNGVRTMIIENKSGAGSTFAFDRKPEPLLNTNVEIPYLDIQPGRPVKDGDPSRLPITKPPYGAVVAMDMNKGEILWKIANGDGLKDHPGLKHLNLPAMGTQSRASPLLTKTLLFIGEGKNGPGGPSRIPAWGGGKTFRALDKVSGKSVWEMELPGGTSGAPMTYTAGGKQYIVVAVGWTDMAPELVALALP